jgi:hypothetical protein
MPFRPKLSLVVLGVRPLKGYDVQRGYVGREAESVFKGLASQPIPPLDRDQDYRRGMVAEVKLTMAIA